MPIYPYICESCSYEFDRLQKISDDPLKVCPECGAESLRKKLTAAAFHLKGTGWYETDFKDKKDDKKEEPKGGDDKGVKKTTDDKKSDAKSSETKPTGASSSSDKGKSSSGSTPAPSSSA